MADDITFDFEQTLEQAPSTTAADGALKSGSGGEQAGGGGGEPKPRNYRQTVCTYWLRGLCMKGDTCGFLHEFNPDRMPVCRNLLKYGQCKEPDCPYKHTTQDIKECNMYKLGFCIYGPACRFKHTRLPGPPPDPEKLEAAKPKEFRNIAIVANQANEGILPTDIKIKSLRIGHGDQGSAGAMVVSGQTAQQNTAGTQHAQAQTPGFVDSALLAAVGQRDLRYGF